MEERAFQTISTFDSYFTTKRIQMLKILFSHLSAGQQGGFAVYIKLLELQHAFSLLQNPPTNGFPGCSKGLSADFFGGDNEDTISLLQELLHFSGPEERKKIENMIQMMENMKKMQEMMDMIKMMQEMFPEGMGGGDGSGGGQNPMDFLSGMMGMPGMDGSGMNMADLFGMFGGNNTNP